MAKSAYIESLEKKANVKNSIQEKIQAVIDYCWEAPADALPNQEMMQIIGSPNPQHFKSAMAHIFREMVLRGDISTGSTVLDIGCGCGRMAIPFSRFLETGKYYGIDVWEEGIEWCRNNIKRDGVEFEFILRESKNNYYFSEVDFSSQNDYHLGEIERNSVDFAFAISLFTHLRSFDCYNYFSELGRVLASGGCAYVTAFIIDEYFFEYVRRTGMHSAVRQIEPGCYYAYSGQDFFAGYTMNKWKEIVDSSGLKIVSYDVGKWAEKPGALNHQDTFALVSSAYRNEKKPSVDRIPNY
ncbi:class I SAM-dependent methyltransferase [Rhizobiales bacterium]|uniref:class I SAM-dependent methyltransferase n=1 Tax=Hongsoonwoonella zoysiae TaxID=2821844 RepID=UPI001560A2F3|nr:class I SAM-dependent methyltransferase [Hongsoonwoonella zoysiae]NRG18539.1 class I SAM-dependent methyltransferase [Hongsoonwoonella zoysiae]